ncbi:Metallo-dependent phosphatase-like protein [Pisolithus marmoratus]|nr:Metallo-dependent phosphatase-like protein [Pisolithus marmoratus]
MAHIVRGHPDIQTELPCCVVTTEVDKLPQSTDSMIINGETLCDTVDSPDIRTLDQTPALSRAQEIPHEGAVCVGCESSRCKLTIRGKCDSRVQLHQLTLIARSHQLVQEGYKYMFGNALVTVWLAPNYCYQCENMTPVLTLRESGKHDFKVFSRQGDGKEESRSPNKLKPIAAPTSLLPFLSLFSALVIVGYQLPTVWKACCNVFDYLNLAAIIDGETLRARWTLLIYVPSTTFASSQELWRSHMKVHSALESFDDVSTDLMWSDPNDIDNWAAGYSGEASLERYVIRAVWSQFNHVNSLTLIARAHQLVQEGYKYMFDNALVTVWPTPNYCYRCMVSVLTLREGGEHDFKVFGPAPEHKKDKGMSRRNPGMQYFVYIALLALDRTEDCESGMWNL